ncbi:class I SAM-dependent methyltransferase [Mycolicibacterium vaccae]|nr:class I SAM-dependent methyltransferase [Mycolicibacterium vaccae]
MSNHPAGDNAGYTARSEYLAEDVAQNYVRNRFSGALGKYRYRREQRAVNKLLGQLPADQISAVLDCPTGIGRWIPNLAAVSPQRIVGVDVSPTMLKRAREVRIAGVSLEFQEGVAESLPFEAGEFDLVFCHALLKPPA